jgi:hypothetical protein
MPRPRQAPPKRSSEEEPAAAERRHPLLLALVGALLVAWLVFLAVLAMRG